MRGKKAPQLYSFDRICVVYTFIYNRLCYLPGSCHQCSKTDVWWLRKFLLSPSFRSVWTSLVKLIWAAYEIHELLHLPLVCVLQVSPRLRWDEVWACRPARCGSDKPQTTDGCHGAGVVCDRLCSHHGLVHAATVSNMDECRLSCTHSWSTLMRSGEQSCRTFSH